MIALLEILIESSSVLLAQPGLLIAAGLTVLGLSFLRQSKHDVNLDRRTLKDIGIEPGSITWTR